MTGEQPWATPDERRLMIRAVARFSESCSAPHLTPECPFYEFDAAGSPACGEQCMDLTARYPDDHVGDEFLSLGPGLQARRARLDRRPPERDQPAYDARQLRLVAQGKPLSEWPIGALLGEARDRARFASAAHEVETALLLSELASRGVDLEMLLLPLARERATAISVAVLFHFREEDDFPVDNITNRAADWISALEAIATEHPEDPHETFMLATVSIPTIASWLESQGMEACLSDAVPPAGELARVSDEVAREARQRATWLVERFTETYLDDWSSSSVRLEYLYQTGKTPGCCEPRLMRQRPVDGTDAARLIADERCSEGEENDGTAALQEQFKSVAISKIREDQFESAVSIFRTLAEMWPHDMDIANNLGFCLLPVDPVEAEALFEAAATGTNTPAITALNVSLAQHLQGKSGGAVRSANAALSLYRDAQISNGWLWVPRATSGEWRWTFEHADLEEVGEAMLEHFMTCGGEGCPLPFSGGHARV